MRTWEQFIEAKAMLAPMNQQPAEYQPGYKPSARRSATPQQQAQGLAAQQGPAYAPASDEEMGAKYLNTINVQAARAAAQKGRV